MDGLERQDPAHLTLLLQLGGDPAETRVYARNGEELPDWQHGPVLAEALRDLESQGWKVSEGRLARRPNTLFPVPILILRKRLNEGTVIGPDATRALSGGPASP